MMGEESVRSMKWLHPGFSVTTGPNMEARGHVGGGDADV